MNYKIKLITSTSFLILLTSIIGCNKQPIIEREKIGTNQKKDIPMKVSIMVGSVRDTPTGKQIAKQVEALIKDRTEITTEIIEIAKFQLPFYTDQVAPASRQEEITDPILKKWSEAIAQAESFIIIAPEYNAGYPAALKNALDSLYTEWNNKPIAFIGYSGGPSGGMSIIKQLQEVARALQMIPTATSINIAHSWKAFNEQGDLINAKNIKKELDLIINELLAAKKSNSI